MTNLRILRITGNQLSGTIPSEFGRLTQLQDLALHNSHLTGSVPQEVCDLRSSYVLHKLNVDCNQGLDGSEASVQCSVPDCCTFCSASLANENWGRL